MPGTNRAEKILQLAGIGVFSTAVSLWIASLWLNPDTLFGHDWIAFYRVGEAVRAGHWEQIYDPAAFPFVYPPYVICLLAPLGWLTPFWAYVACVACSYLALAVSLWLLYRLLPARREQHVLVTSLTLASAPWLGVTITGQLSALYLLAILAGWLAWRNHKPWLAGLAFSLLLIKPNLAIPCGVLCLAKRQGRMAGTMLLAAGVLVAVTIPMGTSTWRAWWDASRSLAHGFECGDFPLTKQLTLLSLWQLLLLARVPPWGVKLVWAMSVAPLGLGLVAVWRGRLTPIKLARLSGASVLFLVAANAYLFFYDGLLLAIPAAVWYLARDAYSDPRRHRLAGVFLLLIYCWGYGIFIPGTVPPLSLIGLAAALWCGVEIWDLLAE